MVRCLSSTLFAPTRTHVTTREPHSERVQIGDVAYIHEGRLNLLFSAGCPQGRRRLGVDVPDTFQQLNIDEIDEFDPLGAGYFCTNGVRAISSSQPLLYVRSVNPCLPITQT